MASLNAQARSRLDDRLDAARSVAEQPRPHGGWIRAIRQALGMSGREFADRLGVTQQTIPDIERSEQRDTIKLETLRRAAAALDCDLAYVLVPRRGLDELVTQQARRKAVEHLGPIAHHSRLRGPVGCRRGRRGPARRTRRDVRRPPGLVDRRGPATLVDPLVPIGDGHTALSEDDRRGLIPAYIATRGDLFDAEQRNIGNALLRRRPPTPEQLLDEQYLRTLHRAMFGEVWEWAGRYRTAETNIGVAPHRIAGDVALLVGDARAWIEYETYEPDELAVRFHHRLVAIHPFPNGNGRHGRIAADYLIRGLGSERFSWGARADLSTDALRLAYRRALEQADRGEIADLVAFART